MILSIVLLVLGLLLLYSVIVSAETNMWNGLSILLIAIGAIRIFRWSKRRHNESTTK